MSWKKPTACTRTPPKKPPNPQKARRNPQSGEHMGGTTDCGYLANPWSHPTTCPVLGGQCCGCWLGSPYLLMHVTLVLGGSTGFTTEVVHEWSKCPSQGLLWLDLNWDGAMLCAPRAACRVKVRSCCCQQGLPGRVREATLTENFKIKLEKIR